MRKIMLGGPFHTMAHQTTDSGRRSVNGSHLQFLGDTPIAVGIWIGGDAFKEDAGGSVHEWTVDDVAMSRDPTDIGGTPIDIALFNIENEFCRCINTDCIATLNVYYSLGLARATTRVKNVEEIFTIHRLAWNHGILWYISS